MWWPCNCVCCKFRGVCFCQELDKLDDIWLSYDTYKKGDVFLRHSVVLYHSFLVGPRTWNDLPDDVTSAESLSAFRQRLKTRLFTKPFSDYSLDWTTPNLSLVDLAVVCITYGGDTQSRNLYNKHVQVDCTRNLTLWHGFLYRYKIFLVQVSCTEYSTTLFHTINLHARD